MVTECLPGPAGLVPAPVAELRPRVIRERNSDIPVQQEGSERCVRVRLLNRQRDSRNDDPREGPDVPAPLFEAARKRMTGPRALLRCRFSSQAQTQRPDPVPAGVGPAALPQGRVTQRLSGIQARHAEERQPARALAFHVPARPGRTCGHGATVTGPAVPSAGAIGISREAQGRMSAAKPRQPVKRAPPSATPSWRRARIKEPPRRRQSRRISRCRRISPRSTAPPPRSAAKAG